jgi:hypothetical protein
MIIKWATLIILLISFDSYAAKKTQISLEILTPEIYTLMSKKDQKFYIQHIRKAWLEFETNLSPQLAHYPSFQFFEVAEADNQSCIVGGAIVPSIRSDKKRLCSTKGRSCGELKDSFQCGEIFNSACISRTPISSLSKRCYEASKNSTPSTQEYEGVVRSIALQYQEICQNNPLPATVEGCITLAKKMTEVSSPNHPQFVLASQVNNPLSDPISRVFSPLHNEYKHCGVAEIDPATKVRLWIPQFKLTPAHICQMNQNRSIFEKLAQAGCSNNPPPLPPYRTVITTEGTPSIRKIGFVTGVTEVERKVGEVIHNLRFLRFDTSARPFQLVEENIILSSRGDRHEVLPTYSPNASGRTARISNTQTNSINLEGGGITNLELEAIMTATRCNMAQKIRELPSYNSNQHRPGPSSSSSLSTQ